MNVLCVVPRCLGCMGGSGTDTGSRISRNTPCPPHNSSQSHSTPKQIDAIKTSISKDQLI